MSTVNTLEELQALLQAEIHEPYHGTPTCDDPRKLIVPIHLITRDPENARLHPDRNIRGIRASLRRKERGQQSPLVVDRDGVIAKGNGTHEAAEAEGWTHIWIVLTSLTGAELRAYGISDNATGLSSAWDYEQLGGHVSGLKDFDGTALEFTNDELGFEEHELVFLNADWKPPAVQNGSSQVGVTHPAAAPESQETADVGSLAGARPASAAQAEGSRTKDPHIDLEEGDRASDACSIICTPNQRIMIDQAIERVRLLSGELSLTEGRCMELIAADYLAGAEQPDLTREQLEEGWQRTEGE